MGEQVKKYNARFATEPNKKINTDEIAIMKLLASADESFIRRLRIIWGTSKMSMTSCPLNLMASPWLLDITSLAACQKANPVWHFILTVTKEKLNLWIQRVDGRFTHLVEETLKKGRAPNLKNYSHQYRDSSPEMAWRMSCCFFCSLPTQKNVFNVTELAIKHHHFCKGLLDADFKDKVQVLDPSFTFDDLRFIRMASLAKQDTDQDMTTVIHAAEKSKALAEVNLFHAKLLGEETAWADYLARRRAITDTSQAKVTKALEEAQLTLEMSVRHHVETFLPAIVTTARGEHVAVADNALYKFIEQLPSLADSGVAGCYRIDVYNLTAMGAQHSSHLPDMIKHASEVHSANPARSASLFFLPNSPVWGAGGGGRISAAEFKEFAAKAADDAKSALMNKAINNWESKEIVGMFNDKDFYSPERKLRVDFVMVISNIKTGSGQLVSEFANSALWKREAVPGLLTSLPRMYFRDWSKALEISSDTVRDANVDRRQWMSGKSFYQQILAKLFDGTAAHPKLAGQIREWTMYDDSLAQATLACNMSKDQNLPLLAWVGMTWGHFIRPGGGKVVHANVFASICDTVAALAKEGKYKLPGFTPVQVKDVNMSAQLPPQPSFELTHPRDNDLPVKQTVLDDILAKASAAGGDLKDQVQQWLMEHDKKYNTSGQPWKGPGKREADQPIAQTLHARAIHVTPRPGVTDVKDVEQLKEKGPVKELKFPGYSLFAAGGRLVACFVAKALLIEQTLKVLCTSWPMLTMLFLT